MKLALSKYGFLLNSVFLILCSFQSVLFAQDNFIGQREQMVRIQIEERGINDKKVLDDIIVSDKNKFKQRLIPIFLPAERCTYFILISDIDYIAI